MMITLFIPFRGFERQFLYCRFLVVNLFQSTFKVVQTPSVCNQNQLFGISTTQEEQILFFQSFKSVVVINAANLFVILCLSRYEVLCGISY